MFDPTINDMTVQTIQKITIKGLGQAVSRLVMGCDNIDSAEAGAPVWDSWLAAGGNAFDTAFVYGGGKCEAALGDWIRARNLSKDTVVICKGAHTPNCTPAAIGEQLAQSLDRLQLDRAPIYIMHRDNPDVPVGEFVDALNALHQQGRIGIFGGSNWSTARFEAARVYAEEHRMQPMTILNNNLSLAVMEKPVWPGCISANNATDLAYLRKSNMIHMSWSSQARGYFLPEDLRHRLSPDTAPETCFGCAANAERRRRAENLAQSFGASANNVAAAWVLGQSFPSFALVGPRTTDEIKSSLPACAIKLSQGDLRWLNLEE
jgi:aryl-alcohol dehydrogenase-like predicted oxidoreductase